MPDAPTRTVDQDQEDAEPVTDVDVARRPWWNSLARIVALFVVLCALAAPGIGYKIHENPALSPIDELNYIDYLQKVDQGHFIIGNGEPLGLTARQAIACRGVPPSYPIDPAACANPQLAVRGRDTADIDPPTYYVITATVGKVIRVLHISDNFVTSVRLVGIFWAGAALTATFLLARLLGASRAASALIVAVTYGMTVLMNTWQYATPHASDAVVGALVAIIAVLYLQGKIRPWPLIFAGLIPPLVKASDVVITAVVALTLLVLAVLPVRGHLDRRRSLAALAWVVGGTALSTAGFLLAHSHYALTNVPAYPQFDVPSFSVHFLTHEIGDFINNPISSSTNGPGAASGPGLVLMVWMFGATLLASIGRWTEPPLARLAGSVLVTALFGSWLFVLSNYILMSQYDSIPGRYGLTLVPIILGFAACTIRERWHYIAVIIGIIGLGVIFFHPSLA